MTEPKVVKIGFQGAIANQVLQGHAFEEFHSQEGTAIFLADVVNSANIGMVQAEADRASRWKRASA